MTDKQFDPTRYLRTLGKGEYLEVKWRLVWLRTEHPDAQIETEMVRWEPDAQAAVFRARVTLPSGASATGWGMEQRGDFYDFVEKAETKALGRALAALGYGTQFTDFDEEGTAQHPPLVVDAPIERPARDRAAAPPQPQQPGPRQAQGQPPQQGQGREQRAVLPATEPQIKAIFAIGRGAQALDEYEVEARCKELYGVTPSGLSRQQASEFIDVLKSGAR